MNQLDESDKQYKVPTTLDGRERFVEVDRMLHVSGIALRTSTIANATITAVLLPMTNDGKERDPEVHQPTKGCDYSKMLRIERTPSMGYSRVL